MTASKLQQLIIRIVGRRDGIEPGFLINQAVREGYSAQEVREGIDWLLNTGQLDFHIERYGIEYCLPEGGVAHG
ncbi:hypothetical protein [Halomonas salipaludis]|uniref:Uncharacterized protein n=1 Tax=Halomonas salipaludis TaxID=2032625 RepID=A0A2A2F2T9_9GAMM|nr:hypothetical protein [Halomonas salipaludis]PAU78925.1 hypothetical protein CK498_00640 [Halomonas salipaludis]